MLESTRKARLHAARLRRIEALRLLQRRRTNDGAVTVDELRMVAVHFAIDVDHHPLLWDKSSISSPERSRARASRRGSRCASTCRRMASSSFSATARYALDREPVPRFDSGTPYLGSRRPCPASRLSAAAKRRRLRCPVARHRTLRRAPAVPGSPARWHPERPVAKITKVNCRKRGQ
jgi:hypothetical protein